MLALRGIVAVPGAGGRRRGAPRRRRASAPSPRDGVRRSTTVTADPPPPSSRAAALRWPLGLEPGGQRLGAPALRPRRREPVTAAPGAPRPAGAGPGPRSGSRSARASGPTTSSSIACCSARCWTCGCCGRRWTATSTTPPASLVRHALRPRQHDHRARDGRLRPARGRADPARARAGAWAASVDPWREEEPGKVLHELRLGEVAAPGLTPLARYYGTVDATPLFLCLLAEHADVAGRPRALPRAARRRSTPRWLDRPPRRPRRRRPARLPRERPDGLRNQGWKDSEDGVVDGRRRRRWSRRSRSSSRRPTSCGPSGARAAARPRRRPGAGPAPGGARRPRSSAALERFWLPERGFYAMALDGDGRPSTALGLQPGPPALGRRRPGRARAARSATRSMGEADVLGLGHPHARQGRARLQPGRLPPRHRLAARHRDLRRPGCAATASTRTSPRSSRRCSRRRRTPRTTACPSCSPGFSRARVRDARALPRRLPPAGVGGRRDPVPAHHRARRCAPTASSGALRSCAGRRCRAGSTASRSTGCASPTPASTCVFERAAAGDQRGAHRRPHRRRPRGRARDRREPPGSLGREVRPAGAGASARPFGSSQSSWRPSAVRSSR